MKRLRAKPRYDTMKNELRARRRAFGQWIYLALVAGLFIWLINLFFGQYLFFRAEGLVTQDRQVIAVSYIALVDGLAVDEGVRVKAGEEVARIRSTQILENVATLSTRISEVRARRADLMARAAFLNAMTPIADRRARDMTELRQRYEDGIRRGLATNNQKREFVEGEYDSALEKARIASEKSTIDGEIAGLDEVLERAETALDKILSVYADGVVTSPSDGVISELHVAQGSVLRAGDPLMEIVVGEPYILAYLTPGSLHKVETGDEVIVIFGVTELKGKITQIYPVSPKLPDEFQKTFRPKDRSQIFRIDLAGGSRIPPTFTKVSIRSRGWLPSWL